MDGEGHKRPGKLHFPVNFNGEIFTEVILFTDFLVSCYLIPHVDRHFAILMGQV